MEHPVGPCAISAGGGPQVAASLRASQDPAIQSLVESAGAPQIYHVGGDVSAPQLIFAPDPGVLQRGQAGEVSRYLRYVHRLWTRREILSVSRWCVTWERVWTRRRSRRCGSTDSSRRILHGKPVAVEVNIEVNFRLY